MPICPRLQISVIVEYRNEIESLLNVTQHQHVWYDHDALRHPVASVSFGSIIPLLAWLAQTIGPRGHLMKGIVSVSS